jgi:hypothetical protein
MHREFGKLQAFSAAEAAHIRPCPDAKSPPWSVPDWAAGAGSALAEVSWNHGGPDSNAAPGAHNVVLIGVAAACDRSSSALRTIYAM